MSPWLRANAPTFLAIAASVGLGLLVTLLAGGRPTADDKADQLRQEIAACRALGGAPHLVYWRAGEFYVRECWLEAR